MIHVMPRRSRFAASTRRKEDRHANMANSDVASSSISGPAAVFPGRQEEGPVRQGERRHHAWISTKAKRWASSASPAAASRRWGVRSCSSTVRPTARTMYYGASRWTIWRPSTWAKTIRHAGQAACDEAGKQLEARREALEKEYDAMPDEQRRKYAKFNEVTSTRRKEANDAYPRIWRTSSAAL